MVGPQLEQESIAAEASRLKSSFLYFFLKAWVHIESYQLIMGRHIELMCEYFQALHFGGYGAEWKDGGITPNGQLLKKLICNVPPEHTKSVCASVMWPAWVYANDPQAEIVNISFDKGLSTRDLIKTRTLMQTDWYRQLFPYVRIDQNKKNTSDEFHLTEGGSRYATTPRGGLTGRHPTHLVIDDPQDPKGTDSESDRRFINRWIRETVGTRGIGKGRRTAIVMQRLHKMDLSGHELERDIDVVLLRLPARHEPQNATPDYGFGQSWRKGTSLGTDWRTKEGEPLFPQRFPAALLDAIEKDLGSYATAGHLQQRPSARGGGMFKVDRIEIVEKVAVPWDQITIVCRSWDFASSDGKGDWTVGMKIGLWRDKKSTRIVIYILNVARGQWATDKKENQVDTLAKVDQTQHGDNYFITIPRDPGAAGKDVVANTQRRLRGVSIRAHSVAGKKTIKADPAALAVNQGEVKMVSAVWNGVVLDELENFPNAEHDDIVDAFAEGYKQIIKGDDWFLGADDEETANTYLRPCASEACNYYAAPDEEYCCECCQVAAADGAALDHNDHSPSCVYRHSNLYAKGEFDYDQPIQ